jgi:hypothetical protein
MTRKRPASHVGQCPRFEGDRTQGADIAFDPRPAVTTSRVDAEELGGVMTGKLAEPFAESATEEHALRPVRRRRLDS